MNKYLWLAVPLSFAFTPCVFAAVAECTRLSTMSFNRVTGTISNFPYDQTTNDMNASGMMLKDCTSRVAVRSTFKANTGSSDLVGSSPFSVGPNITITGSSADAATLVAAKTWLSANIQIAFALQDGLNPSRKQDVTALDTDFNILPYTGAGSPVTIAGESYYRGETNNGTVNVGVLNPVLRLKLLANFKPSAAVIDALNNATVRIRLGTIEYKFDDYGSGMSPSGVLKTGSTDVYINLHMNFAFPTCTTANQSVNLATVPTSVLNSSQTANEQSFEVTINCSAAMPSKVLVATFVDSFSPGNVNSNGILKNQPSLANRSNVDVQLRDESNIPMEIGSQKSFYSVPSGSTETKFSKKLKAQYFRSAPTATPGYVHAKTTVLLDYQ